MAEEPHCSGRDQIFRLQNADRGPVSDRRKTTKAPTARQPHKIVGGVGGSIADFLARTPPPRSEPRFVPAFPGPVVEG